MKIIGFIDTFNEEEGFSGWACCKEKPDEPLEFSFVLDGREEGISITRVDRPDLRHLGLGMHGFIIRPHHISSSVSRKDFTIRAKLRAAKSSWQDLSPGGLLLEQIARAAWMRQLASLGEGQLRAALSEISTRLDHMSAAVNEPRFSMAPSALRGTPVLLPVGLKSLDEALVMGEEGHAFLIGGSNDVLASFDRSNAAEHEERARRWADLFATRNTRSLQRKIDYVQCIIPEKISVMPEISGLEVETPGPTLRFLERQMALRQVACPSLLTVLRQAERCYDLFDRMDTHLSASGSFLCFMALLAALDIHLPAQPDFLLPETPILGDVSDRFFNVPLLCRSETISRVPVPLSEDELRLASQYDPPGGGHIGIRRIFENRNAPVQKKVIAFANSFFERGGVPKTLSWWFARTFREFHFIWSPDFDWEYVDHVKPDILVGQTIERFLTQIPAS